MNVAALEFDLQLDLNERYKELRFFHNQVQSHPVLLERDAMRRPLVLLLYAHFEGFAKFTLDAYITSVNAEGLSCAQASEAIAATTLSPVFEALRSPRPLKEPLKGIGPGDTKLIRFAKEREFIERAYLYLDQPVNIPSDVLETESNLKSLVMRKLLYQVGLDPEIISDYSDAIDELVSRRNKIAHGSDLRGVREKTYLELRGKILRVMSGLVREITTAAREEHFRRP
jgi:hypothetical protein